MDSTYPESGLVGTTWWVWRHWEHRNPKSQTS